MKRRLWYVLAAVSLVTAACSDNQLSPNAAGPSIRPNLLTTLVPPPVVCQSVAESQKTINVLVPQLFGPGQGRRGKAQGYSNNIEQARRNGNTALERTYVDSLVNFTLETYYDGNLIGGQSTDTQQRVLTLIYALYCASGISPIPDLSGILSAENTVLIRNNTPATVVNAPDNDAGVLVDQGDVPATQNGVPFFGTFVSVYRTTNPLPTSLDWYGLDGYRQGAFEFVANPAVTFTSPVLTGVCIAFDNDIVAAGDLRLAHQVAPGSVPAADGNRIVTTAGGTIEVLAPASPAPLGLSCSPIVIASRGVIGRFLAQLADVILPSQLLAFEEMDGGGIAGQADTFSPFAAVDTKLAATGTGPSSPQYIPVGSSSLLAPVSVAIRTRHPVVEINGVPAGQAPIEGVTVAFGPGGFSPASAVTGATGTASASWTLVAGTNTGTGTPSLAPFTFSGSPVNFSVEAIQIAPVVVSVTPAPPGGTVGVTYTPFTFAATGGTGTFSWTVAGGALPGGLALSSAGVLTGTPTGTGSFTFTVRATSGPAGLEVTGDAQFTIVVALPAPTAITLAFDVGPSKSSCYAVNVPMSPGIRVKVTDQAGNLLSGVAVSMVAVTNNGAKVAVTPSSVTSSGGYANFGGPTINKAGGYALMISTAAPWPTSSSTSGKFNVSPSCS